MNVFPASVYRATFFVNTAQNPEPKVNINVRSNQGEENTSALMIAMTIDEAMSLGEDLIGQARRLQESVGFVRRPPIPTKVDYSPSRAAHTVFASPVDIPDDRSDFTRDDEATGT